MEFIGIDPGVSGAISVIDNNGKQIAFIKNKETERDVQEFLNSHNMAYFAVIEKVHSMPAQGVASSFKFGKSYGFLRGILVASGIPFEGVSPQKWQKVMECRTGGDKNVSKARAQQLFPTEKITHATADAMLLAEYCRRLYNERNAGKPDPF